MPHLGIGVAVSTAALVFSVASAAASLPTSLQLKHMPVQRCYDEKFPYGTGIGVLSDRDTAKDLNTVILVKKVYPNGVPTGLRPMGYLLRIATGAFYYQPQPGPILTTLEKMTTLAYLNTPGVVVRRGTTPMQEIVASPLPKVIPVNYSKDSLRKANLNVLSCTPR
jgi:hypothetical protein